MNLWYQMPHIPKATIYDVVEPQKSNFEFLGPPAVVYWEAVGFGCRQHGGVVELRRPGTGAPPGTQSIKYCSMFQAVDGPKK